MTETADTITNYRASYSNDDSDHPVDSFVSSNDHQEYLHDELSLFDDDEDNLTLFDLKSIPKSHHDLSIFDELAHQCDAVLHATNQHHQTTTTTTTHRSRPSDLMTTSTMIDDCERRFQRSLHKLTVPAWYNETAPSLKISSKPSIISTSHQSREPHRTPEIVHVQRPHSYRSCRSSLGTSPSPSVHSWHPNQTMDGMNFSLLSPSSTSRRRRKYEKGIERVVKSSRWYQPTHFEDNKKHAHTGNSKTLFNEPKRVTFNQHDLARSHDEDQSDFSSCPQANVIPNRSGLSFQQKSNDIENNNKMSNSIVMKEKQSDSPNKSNEVQLMTSNNTKISCSIGGGSVELEEVTDEDDNDKRSTSPNVYISSTVEQIDADEDDEMNALLERLATNLVDSILNEILLMKSLDPEDENNRGVRELSDDENALRELDENDMSGTDEFIVFAPNAETSDDEKTYDQDDSNPIQTPSSSAVPRGSLNRLYTFSRTNDDGTINARKTSPSQDSSTSELINVDKDILPSPSLLITESTTAVQSMNTLDHNHSIPSYRSHIQKRQINLGRYYDGMMRATNSQLPTYDLRCNLNVSHSPEPNASDGVTEETVRKARVLLDSIANSVDLIPRNEENTSEQSQPVRSILKNTRTVLSDRTNEPILQIEERETVSPRKIITTTITEEYHRIQRQVIEEIEPESSKPVCRASNHQEQINTCQPSVPSVTNTDRSPYQLLSECYSGYSLSRSDLLTVRKAPLVSNVSSLQSTTDEAYESEPTTMSSSITTHVHPDLEHEFEYPSPPPPVPDRRLKPAHLRPPPPPTKPRSSKQRSSQNDAVVYSKIRKPKTSPLAVIQHLITTPTTSTDSALPTTRTLSSRHYCGSLPLSNEPIGSSSQTKRKTDDSSRRNSKTLSCINSSTTDDSNQQIKFTKPSSTSLTRIKVKKPSTTYYDEATNGLPIRLPAPETNEHQPAKKQNPIRTSPPASSSSTRRSDGSIKGRPVSANVSVDRSSVYETSV